MREHTILLFGSSVYFIDLGKILNKVQSAGNPVRLLSCLGSSETTREAIILDEKFKWWFIGFTESDNAFILNKKGYLYFKVTQSSVDAKILFYIKKELGFGSVSLQSKENKTNT